MGRKQSTHHLTRGLLAFLLVLSCFNPLQAQNKNRSEEDKKGEAPAPMKLKVGDMAPDFTMLAFDGKDLKKVSLQDYRGKKNVALAFFVFAFTGG
jgi:AhpC/TSA family